MNLHASTAWLRSAIAVGALRPLDLHFAHWLQRATGEAEPAQLLAAVLVSQRTGAGDVCLDLATIAGTPVFDSLPAVRAPALAPWREALQRWSVVGAPGAQAPLILDAADRLYLGRYWAYEHAVAKALRQRASAWSADIDLALLHHGLNRLFGPLPAASALASTDWQRVAAAIAVLKPLCVISGGPGTGKTHTVAAILALLAQQARHQAPDADRSLRIALAAPTGKAAARLTEAIRNARERLDPELARLIPEPDASNRGLPVRAQTLHRLLGTRPGRVRPRHHRDDPLPLDLLVLDEASMLDLPLMARLLDALPSAARLILLGDRDQLASVESGMVLGDLCGRGLEPVYSPRMQGLLRDLTGLHAADRMTDHEPEANNRTDAQHPPLSDCIALLRKSRRFTADSGVGSLAAAVNAADTQSVRALAAAGLPDVRQLQLDEHQLRQFLAAELVPRWRAVLAGESPLAVLRALAGFRLLCAVRQGPFGVEGLNAMAESVLARAAVIQPAGRQHYPGRPVMVTSNDYAVGLYNGDIGVVLPDPHAEQSAANAPAADLPQGAPPLRVWFETDDGVRRIPVGRLPAAQSVFAMTVHKAQGSEFDDVILVLPPHPSRALTRELLYTGITRARRRVTLIAPLARLDDALSSPQRRTSGLFDALWRS